MERRGEEEMKWEVFYTLTGSSEFSLFLAWGTQRAYNAPQWHPELEPALRDDASLRGLAAILSLRNNRGRCANTHPTSKHISLTRPHVAHSSFTRGGVIEKDKRTRRDTLTRTRGTHQRPRCLRRTSPWGPGSRSASCARRQRRPPPRYPRRERTPWTWGRRTPRPPAGPSRWRTVAGAQPSWPHGWRGRRGGVQPRGVQCLPWWAQPRKPCGKREPL
mmetsp:Transcript_10056/g.27525  ORF Transcript_10056/g.27525 Transcript_10056/m.27525 type:complete len:218 (+) Transcript_10056:103-756(+)